MIAERTVRTFAVSLDIETAAKLEKFLGEHCRATAESVIETAVTDAMADADPRETTVYRRYLGRQSSERASRRLRASAKGRNRRRFVLAPSMPGEPKKVDIVSVEGFFGTFAFAADRSAFRQFAAACEALNLDRSEALFDAVSIGIEGVIATAALTHPEAQ
jgi:hypothetical protein